MTFEFTIDTGILKKGMELVTHVIVSDHVLPILDCVLFKVTEKKLLLSATDLNSTITECIETDYKGKDFSIAVPAKILQETLNLLPETSLQFVYDEKKKSLLMTSLFGEYKISIEIGEDYPKPPVVKDNHIQCDIDCNTFLEAIDVCSFAVSSDELRPAMTGVLFEIKDNNITFVATDVHKMVKYCTTSASMGNVDLSCIIPAKCFRIMKTLFDSKGSFSLKTDGDKFFIEHGSMTYIFNTIDSRYPDWKAVWPKENTITVITDRLSLIGSCKRLIIYSDKTTRKGIFNFNKLLRVDSVDLNFSLEGQEGLNFSEKKGEDIKIGLNLRYMVECLSVIKSDEVELLLSEPNRPVIINPVDEDEKKKVSILIMPLMSDS